MRTVTAESRPAPVDGVPDAHDWMPWSPCAASCAVPDPAEPMVGAARAWSRLLMAFGVLLSALPLALVYRLGGRDGWQAASLRWSRLLLAAFGVRLRVVGTAGFPPGALVVANHVSWLDVPALNAVQPTRMVAKREVRTWPLVGRLATAAGSLYVERERLSTLPRAVADIAAALRAGDTVTVFPEGTTWCGRASGQYRAAAFQAAIDAAAPVVPVALRFLVDGAATSTPAYVGYPTLWPVLPRTARLRGLVVEVEVLPALLSAQYGAPRPHGRRALAHAAQQAVAAASQAPPSPHQPSRVRAARPAHPATHPCAVPPAP